MECHTTFDGRLHSKVSNTFILPEVKKASGETDAAMKIKLLWVFCASQMHADPMNFILLSAIRPCRGDVDYLPSIIRDVQLCCEKWEAMENQSGSGFPRVSGASQISSIPAM